MHAFAAWLCLFGAIDAGEALRAEVTKAVRDDATSLRRVANDLEKAGKAETAAEIRDFLETQLPYAAHRFRPLPEVVTQKSRFTNDEIGESAATQIKQSAARFFALAQRAASSEVGRFGLADELLRLVLERDPDHAEARRLMGFVRHKEGWATPHAAQQLREGKVRHETFGWVPASWVTHLEKGELPGQKFRGEQPSSWLPAAEADALRADFWSRPWTITTHHFEIRTNVSLTEAIAFGRTLEAFHDLFFAKLADLIGPERLPLAQRFADPKLAPKATPKRFKVWYFAERGDFVAFFRREFHRDETRSLGYTMPPSEARELGVEPRSYFYRDLDNPIDETSTLYHEASHQLLFESAGTTQFERNRGHFWLWEGLGTYFETVRTRQDGTLSVGGVIGPRMQMAHDRLVERGALIPIEALCRLSREGYLKEPDVYLNYAQSMALAAYLLDGSEEAYREAFLRYVRRAYEGRLQNGPTFESATGLDPEQIGAQLVEFLRVNAPPKIESSR